MLMTTMLICGCGKHFFFIRNSSTLKCTFDPITNTIKISNKKDPKASNYFISSVAFNRKNEEKYYSIYNNLYDSLKRQSLIINDSLIIRNALLLIKVEVLPRVSSKFNSCEYYSLKLKQNKLHHSKNKTIRGKLIY